MLEGFVRAPPDWTLVDAMEALHDVRPVDAIFQLTIANRVRGRSSTLYLTATDVDAAERDGRIN
jgi:hypothetical protein